MTLPLIHALNGSDKQLRSHIIKIIKNENTNPKKIQEVTEFVINSPGIAYTRQKMNEYRDDAIQLLRTFPPSVAREAMEDLILFVTERKR
jgi:octaprenyl-diphosphate synthase